MPGFLWLFGEKGCDRIYMRALVKKEILRRQRPFHEQEEKEEVRRIKRLFPEAIIEFPDEQHVQAAIAEYQNLLNNRAANNYQRP